MSGELIIFKKHQKVNHATASNAKLMGIIVKNSTYVDNEMTHALIKKTVLQQISTCHFTVF